MNIVTLLMKNSVEYLQIIIDFFFSEERASPTANILPNIEQDSRSIYRNRLIWQTCTNISSLQDGSMSYWYDNKRVGNIENVCHLVNSHNYWSSLHSRLVRASI